MKPQSRGAVDGGIFRTHSPSPESLCCPLFFAANAAVQMNIIIMRAFIRMREMIASNKDFAARIEALERGHDRTASVIEILVEDIDRLAHTVKEMKALPPVTKRKIGCVLDRE